MAKLYGNIASNTLLTLDKTFSRANGQPLDGTTLWYSLTAAQNYAKTNEAYVGQNITVVESGVVTNYSIIDVNGTLKEIGQGTGTDQKLEWGSF